MTPALFEHPPMVVERALRRAGIGWGPSQSGRQGVFTAERCPVCPAHRLVGGHPGRGSVTGGIRGPGSASWV
jgi:hypothetical protein